MIIDQDVLDILKRSKFNDHILVLPQQLERKMYVKVNQVIEEGGGKWDRHKGGHVFTGDAFTTMEKIANEGRVDTQKEMGAFFTPPAVVERMIQKIGGIKPGMLVLEPSAGAGNIAREAARLTASVDCIEIQERYCEILRKEGIYRNVFCRDFLTTPGARTYDLVVMNPPFSGQSDITHFVHALLFVKTGGTLISVMCGNILFRSNKKTIEFLDLIGAHQGFIEKLPPNSFKEEGTEVPSLLVMIKKYQPLMNSLL